MAKLTGTLLEAYKKTVKYDQVTQVSVTQILGANLEIAQVHVVDIYLLVVGKARGANPTYTLVMANLNDVTQKQTRNLGNLKAPEFFATPHGLVWLSKPSFISKILLTGGVWGDVQTESLTTSVDSPITTRSHFSSDKVWVGTGVDVLLLDIPTLASQKIKLPSSQAVSSLASDGTDLYVARTNTAQVEVYSLATITAKPSAAAGYQPYKTIRIRADKKPAYLNTINHLAVTKGHLILASYDGGVLDYNLDKRTTQQLLSVMTDIKYLRANPHYVTIVSQDGEVRLYDVLKHDEITLDTSGLEPHSLQDPNLSEQFLALIDKAAICRLYKLEDLPRLNLNYFYIESKDANTKYLDLHADLQNSVANVVTKTPYEIAIQYRGATAVKTFPETGLSRNFYIPLNMFPTILTEPSFYLGSEPITHSIKNLQTGLTVVEPGTTLYDGKLEKIFIKDVYTSDDDLYFKIMYLATTPVSIEIKVGDRKILYTTETPLTHNPADYQAVYTQADFPQIHTKFYLVKFPSAGNLNSKEVTLSLDLFVKKVKKDSIIMKRPVTPKYAYKDIKYSTSDGDIRYQDELLLTELEQGDKRQFLRDNSLTPALLLISKMDIRLTDDSKLGNIMSGEGDVGYMSFPIRSDYAHNLYKSDSLVMDIYVNGLKLPRSSSIQQYTLEGGALRVDYPVRDLQAFLTQQQMQFLFDKTVSDEASGITILVTVRRKGLVDGELLLGSYVVGDTYQNDIEHLQGNGIYIPFTTKRTNLSQAELRLFIRNKSEDLIRRFNPSNYELTLNLANKQILIRLLGTTNLDIGSELIIVDSGYLTHTIKYVNINSAYRMDSLPLVTFDSKNNMYDGLASRAEDLDVTVDGLTLVPGRDYNVLTPKLASTPTMLTFRNYIPVGSVVEVNYLHENAQRIFYWATPAVGTTNVFSLDDERYIFVKGTFETFVNNKKVDEAKVTILNNRSIQINVPDPANVMVRFSTRPHSNLKLIQDSYKFSTINILDNNYHSAFTPGSPSTYDKKSLGISTDIGKVNLLELINTNQEFILDCNKEGKLMTDVYLDSRYINNQYITADLVVDANRASNIPDDRNLNPTNPQI